MAKFIDLINIRFGRLTVIKYLGRKNKSRQSKWLCQCDCGNQVDVFRGSLRSGATTSCGCYFRDMVSSIRLGKSDPALSACTSPTVADIAWAAGIYEGEGHARQHRRIGSQVRITQKDPWILMRLKRMFGGSIYKNMGINVLGLHGARARGFLMTIYKFLSPWRKAQALKVFA